jgi:hypothetical protein
MTLAEVADELNKIAYLGRTNWYFDSMSDTTCQYGYRSRHTDPKQDLFITFCQAKKALGRNEEQSDAN